jgi:hypothetical protein
VIQAMAGNERYRQLQGIQDAGSCRSLKIQEVAGDDKCRWFHEIQNTGEYRRLKMHVETGH